LSDHSDIPRSQFEPNDHFPRGLKLMIADIKSKYKNIKLFGIWHALFGYWGGISSTGYIAENYKTRRVKTVYLGHHPADMLIVDPSDIDRFYDDLYSWMRGQGIDFVKTDVQHMLSMLEDGKDRREVTTAYQRAWTTAICKHFQGRVRRRPYPITQSSSQANASLRQYPACLKRPRPSSTPSSNATPHP
jgi:hypothetical protein